MTKKKAICTFFLNKHFDPGLSIYLLASELSAVHLEAFGNSTEQIAIKIFKNSSYHPLLTRHTVIIKSSQSSIMPVDTSVTTMSVILAPRYSVREAMIRASSIGADVLPSCSVVATTRQSRSVSSEAGDYVGRRQQQQRDGSTGSSSRNHQQRRRRRRRRRSAGNANTSTANSNGG